MQPKAEPLETPSCLRGEHLDFEMLRADCPGQHFMAGLPDLYRNLGFAERLIIFVSATQSD